MWRSSSLVRRPIGIRGVALYGVAAVVALFELGSLWLALHPNVDNDYRAYFLDKTTTCLNQSVSGKYTLGERISFTSYGWGPGKNIKVCGWDGPAGNGLHSVGEESRLRFRFAGSPPPARLNIGIEAIVAQDHPFQRVILTGNGVRIAEVEVRANRIGIFDLDLPPAVFADHPHLLDLKLSYPDAVRMNPGDADVIKRAIKLRWAELDPAEGLAEAAALQ